LITGPSGCGKSTLLKIISSLLSPTQGDILLAGESYRTLAPEQYRQQVSYCFQTPLLFGNTVYDNLALPYQVRQQPVNRQKIIQHLESVQLPASLLDKSITGLSGGEKQRVGLLRNLQFTPQVLLLDEVTSALDENNKETVHGIIQHLIQTEAMAVLWVTHDKSEFSQADEVIHLPARQQEQQVSHE